MSFFKTITPYNSCYYPFGMPMPNRNTINNQYRYAYQGQEKDPETGKEAFELRLWDSRIGRWLTTDPVGQHHSPYQGMGNNPISLIDPDGAWVEGAGFWNNLFHSDKSIYMNDYGYTAAEAQSIINGDMIALGVITLRAPRKPRSNFSPLPGFITSYDDQRGSGPQAISIGYEYAFLTPNSKGEYGKGTEIGFVQNSENGKLEEFRTRKIANKPSIVSLGVGINYITFVPLEGQPVNKSTIVGSGTELSASYLFLGGSTGANTIYENGAKNTMRVHTISIGLDIGLDGSFSSWITNTD